MSNKNEQNEDNCCECNCCHCASRERGEDNTLTMEKLRKLEKAGWLKLGESHYKYPPAAEKDGE